jgi:hypothetical protein
MIRSILTRVFGCHHKRSTWPITPVRSPGAPGGETYVVCLDCGRQFVYDWGRMRIGERIGQSSDAGVLPPGLPGRPKKIKYALIGSGVSFAVLLGSNLMKRRRAGEPSKPGAENRP